MKRSTEHCDDQMIAAVSIARGIVEICDCHTTQPPASRDDLSVFRLLVCIASGVSRP